MNTKKLFKDFFSFATAYYTAITLLILLIASGMTDDSAVKIIEIGQFFKILLFSAMMALGSAIYRVETLSRMARTLIHAACYIGGFLLFFILAFAMGLSSIGTAFATSMIATVCFAIVYVTTMLISASFRKKSKPSQKVEAKKPEKAAKVSKKQKPQYRNQFQ